MITPKFLYRAKYNITLKYINFVLFLVMRSKAK